MCKIKLLLFFVVLNFSWCSGKVKENNDTSNREARGVHSEVRQNCSNKILRHDSFQAVQLQSLIQGCVFGQKIVILGGQGSGKSSLGNSFLGWTLNSDHSGPFNVGHGVDAGTLQSSYSSGAWLGKKGSPGVTIVDTPGFNSSFKDMEELVWLLADLQEVDLFVIVFKHGDRFSSELARSLKTIGRLLGSIWRNTLVVVSHWSFDAPSRFRRKNTRVNKNRYAEQLAETLKEKLEIDFQMPIFFVDSHHNNLDRTEKRNFESETSSLWKFLQNARTWKSITKSDIDDAVRDVKRKFGELQHKCSVFAEEKGLFKNLEEENQEKIKAQTDLIEFMRKQIDHMKKTCL